MSIHLDSRLGYNTKVSHKLDRPSMDDDSRVEEMESNLIKKTKKFEFSFSYLSTRFQSPFLISFSCLLDLIRYMVWK